MGSSRILPSLVALVVSAISLADALSPAAFAQEPFDVIVVGGGTAGPVLANRLSASPSSLRVGLIEAGADRPVDPLINTPTAGNLLGNAHVGTLLGNPTYDWELKSAPQPALNGQELQYPRGKVMGGSSAINSMVWQRGSRADYDAWGTTFENGEEWNFDALLPFFMRSESWHPPEENAAPLFPSEHLNISAVAAFHGTEGPVSVTYNTYLTDLDAPAAQAAVKAAQVPPNSNPDGGADASMPATGTARTVTPNGLRHHAAAAYLSTEVRTRPNLEVLAEATVSRIIFETKKGKTKATAVEYVSGGKTYTVEVRKEVIMAAGAIHTPQILELSGVGNKTLLESLGIPVVLDLPEVGENLQDHPVTLSDFRVVPNVVTLDTLGYNSTFASEQAELYKSSRSGILTYTSAPLGPVPLQSMTTPEELAAMRKQLDEYIETSPEVTPFLKKQYDVLRDIVDKGEDGWVEMVLVPAGGVLSTPEAGKSYLTAVAIQLHPFGRGSVHIKSADIAEAPVIDPRFLELPWDFNVLVQGAQFIRKWVATEPLASYVDKIVTPPESTSTREDWEKYVRSVVRTTNHPLGTTAMAPRELGGVVDPALKVYGLENVRVVDASIIPLTIGVAIMPTVYAVAEKAADILLKEWKLDASTGTHTGKGLGEL
ncbi:GMC oxidoreductase [Auriscalpium vulgare]|uniref:GMC oxidoreductase n=1 Tax=Auriscalpium vulgare TaxID=40419 RepID=A0ACB8S9W9_9AGAM|nr:GMC oxidoreductase [Auriscalpium vulgare]